jgi:hypothetical protein
MCHQLKILEKDCVGMENMGTKSLIKVVPSFVLLISFIHSRTERMGSENNWEKAADGLHDKHYNKGCVTLWPCQKNALKETKILQDIITL